MRAKTQQQPSCILLDLRHNLSLLLGWGAVIGLIRASYTVLSKSIVLAAIGLLLVSQAIMAQSSPQNLLPYASFRNVKIDPSKQDPTISVLPYIQPNFSDYWNQILKPATQAGRYQAMDQICKSMDQETAVAFAGYIGYQNGILYDYRRNSHSSETDKAYVNEVISLEDYYEVHRNFQGFGQGDRMKMGVCGDSALMVADFLSRCGFQCNDVEILSYRYKGGGHQMVSARGNNGELYSANWSESLKEASSNSLDYHSPSTMMSNQGASVSLYDCQGYAKGRTTTPIGSILLKAHGEERYLVNTGDYYEFSTQFDKTSVDKLLVKIFNGESLNNKENVTGIGIQVYNEFFKSNPSIVLDFRGSLIFAMSQTELGIFYGNEYKQKNLAQTWITPNVHGKLTYWPVRSQKFSLGLYGSADYTFFAWNAKVESDDSNVNFQDMDLFVDTGLNVNKQIGKTSLQTKLGVTSDLIYNVSQNGGLVVEDDEIVDRHLILKANHYYVDSKLLWRLSKKSKAYLGLRYDNFIGIDRRRLIWSGGINSKKSNVEIFYSNLSDAYYLGQKSAGFSIAKSWTPNLDMQLKGQHYFSDSSIDKNTLDFRVNLRP